jgi:hypothetical protein
MKLTDKILIPEIATPSTPGSGELALYPKSDHKLYRKDSTGTETEIGATDPTVSTITSSATPTPDSDTTEVYTITALAADATFGSPTGTPAEGRVLLIRIKDNGTARALSWNSIYRALGVTLPTTTVISKTLYVLCVYNNTDTKWDVVATNQEA